MALQQTINLPSGTTGDYVRLTAYRWDRNTRELSAHFQLWLDQTHAAADAASLGLIAMLRLSGDSFDRYLAPSVLAQSGITVAGQLYRAAKTEPIIPGAGLKKSDLSFATANDV
jgi:hypothetical protein